MLEKIQPTLSRLCFIGCLGLLQLASAQVPQLGPCPNNIGTVSPFALQAFLGRWYEYSNYPFIFELNTRCIYAEYGRRQDGKVSVNNYSLDRTTGMRRDIQGSATIQAPGKLLVTFPNVPSFVGPANYWVLGTDYDSYAVIYSCTDVVGIFHAKVVWILTRDRFPSQRTIQTAMNVITRNGLSLKPLQRTDQQNCPAS